MLNMIKAWQCTEIMMRNWSSQIYCHIGGKTVRINAHKIRLWVVPLFLVCCAWHEWKLQQKKGCVKSRVKSFCMLLAPKILHSHFFPEACLQWCLQRGTTHSLTQNYHQAICLFVFFITDFLKYTNTCALLGKKI